MGSITNRLMWQSSLAAIEGAFTDGLAWEMDYAALRSSEKKVFAHYFGPYPRSWSNEAMSTQAYENYYNNPNYTTNGDEPMGGMFRDRPLTRPQLSGDWLYQDSQWDIEQAMAGGIDGWVCDLLGTSGSNHDRYMKMVEVAHDLDNGFKVIPMIDMNGNTRASSPAVAADAVRKYFLTGGLGSAPRKGAWRLSDGRYVVSAFKGEGPNPIDVDSQAQWIQDLFSELSTTWGVQVAYMPCYLNWNYSSNAAFTPLQWGSGSWGYGADPAAINAASNQTAAAKARGEKSFMPICSQDIRYGNGGPKFDEALNTGAQRAAWTKAINEDTDFVQLVTYNDFSETPIAPSAANGWCILDIGSYFITRWKTGQYPAITRDVLYLSHRSQTLDATTTGPQSLFDVQAPRGSTSTVRDHVEVLSFLKAPATITVNTGSGTQNYNAPAGMYVWSAQCAPCAPNVIAASAVRSGVTVTSVTSPVGHRTSDVSTDRGYYRFGSIRGTAGQFDVLGNYR